MVKLHFLNVGHGDCTIIEHASGNLTMIDVNNADRLDDDSRKELAEAYGIKGRDYAAASLAAGLLNQSFRKTFLEAKGYDIELTDPVSYYLDRWKGKPIFRFIATHPDLDHLRGLKRISQEGIPILNFWDTNHNIIAKDCQSDKDEAEWAEYRKLRTSTSEPKVFLNYRDAKGKYWNQDDTGGSGDGLYILAPTPELRDAADEADDPNAHSYVIWFQYGTYKVVLGGDATNAVWESIYRKYGAHLKCNVLKASHHGRDSGFHLEAVKAMSPEFTIVSVGKKPDTDASDDYRKYSGSVWSTRWRGNIVLTIQPDGKATIDSEYNRQAPTTPIPTSEVSPRFLSLGR